MVKRIISHPPFLNHVGPCGTQPACVYCLVHMSLYDILAVSDIHGSSLIHVKESLRSQTQHYDMGYDLAADGK